MFDCWHQWSKWKDIRAGAQARPILDQKQPTGDSATAVSVGDYWIEQESRCNKCGKVRLRTEKA